VGRTQTEGEGGQQGPGVERNCCKGRGSGRMGWVRGEFKAGGKLAKFAQKGTEIFSSKDSDRCRSDNGGYYHE